MSILDDILGNSDSSDVNASSNDFGTDVATSPGLGLALSDVLSSESSDGEDGDMSSFTGIGGLGLGLEAPSAVGIDSSSDQFSASESDSGADGLLSGLL